MSMKIVLKKLTSMVLVICMFVSLAAPAVGEAPLSQPPEETVYPDGTTVYADGTVVYADGTIMYADGTILSAAGATVDADGTTVYPDGTALYADGRIVYADGTTAYPDGTTVYADGSVAYVDGTIMLADGTMMYPDGTIVYADGTTVYSDGVTVDANGNTVYPDGTTLYVDGTIVYADGTTAYPDGTVVYPDGTTLNPDGSTVYPDGTTVYADGTTVNPDGTTVYPDGITVYADGTKLYADGTVVNPDGTTVYSDGTTVYPDGTTVYPDGTTLNPDGSTVYSDGTTVYADGTTLYPDGRTVYPDGTTVYADGTTLNPDGTLVDPELSTDPIPEDETVPPEEPAPVIPENREETEGEQSADSVIPADPAEETQPETAPIPDDGEEKTETTIAGKEAEKAEEAGDTEEQDGEEAKNPKEDTEKKTEEKSEETAEETSSPAEELPLRTLTVSAGQMAFRDQYLNPTEPVIWSGSVWNWLYGSAIEPAYTDDRVMVEISGHIPETVTARAMFIEFADAGAAQNAERALMLLDVALLDESGAFYVPAEKLHVSVSSGAVSAAASDGEPFVAYFDDSYDGVGDAGDIKVRLDESIDGSRLAYVPEQDEALRFWEAGGRLSPTGNGSVDFDENRFPFRFVLSAQQEPREEEELPEQDAQTQEEQPQSTPEAQQNEQENVVKDVTLSGTVVASDGYTYEVSVSYPANCGIPAGVQLSVEELLLGTDAYWAYINQSAEELGVSPADLSLARAFDISFVDPATGEHYQPTKDVQVSILLLSTPVNTEEEISVLHFDDEAGEVQSMDVALNGETIEFETNGFSVFVVLQRVIEKNLTAGDGYTYHITVDYDSTSGIPDGVELEVYEIREGDAAYNDYVARSAAELGENVESLSFARAFDISLVDPATGIRYQPNKNVKVSIQVLDENLSDYESIDVVHFGNSVEVMNARVNGEAVEFATDGFSVYVLIGSDAQTVTPQNTYTFWIPNTDAAGYKEYSFTDSQGRTIYRQTITSGEELIVPQPGSSDSRTFAGWYQGDLTGGTLALAAESYDFDHITITENSMIDLYAVYQNYAVVIFHDQYDSNSRSFPVAYTRRAELVPTGEGESATAFAKVKISDLNTTYTSSGGANMAFFGWSETPITTPGAAKDDEGNNVAAISTDAGCITVSGEKHLYPIFKEIHQLTYYSAQSGLSAAYVPSKQVYAGDPVSYTNNGTIVYSLPVTFRDGYTFLGWWTGTLSSDGDVETVNYGAQVTKSDGSLVASLEDGGVYIVDGKLFLRSDTVLFARWEASYRIIYWKQVTSESPDTAEKHYEYADTVTKTAQIGDTVSIAEKDRASDRYGASYVLGHYDASAMIRNSKELTALNVYYDLSEEYTESGQGHTLTFADSVIGEGAATMPAPETDIASGENLKPYIPDKPTSGRKSDSGNEVYSFDTWYMDQGCSIKANLEAMAMPDHDLTVYAGWTPIKFTVDIDPNYGALYAEENGTGTGATYFNSTFDAEPIGEYTHVTRDYVESSSGLWYYANHDRSYGGDRRTYYTQNPALATEDTTFEYSPGTYTYVGWFEVYLDDNGNEIGEASEPYDFSQHIDHNTKLRLHWKKAGTYYLAYDAGDGTLEDGTKTVVLSDRYADYAELILTQSAKAPTGYTFTGWQVRGSEVTTIYKPGQNFILHADDAKRVSGKDIVYLDAVFTKVGTATIIYDANGGTVTENNVDFGQVPGSAAWDSASGTVDITAGTATVSGLTNNSKLKLSDGTGFTAPADSSAAFLGWSDKAVCDDSATFYAKDSDVVYGVAESTTLYAVWGAQVTYNLNSTDAGWGSEPWDPAVYTHNSNTYSQTVNIGTTVSEPEKVPVYTGADGRLFQYWATRISTGDETNPYTYTEYDFSQPITGALDLYAYWSEANVVVVHAVDASEKTLADKTEVTGWEVTNVTVSATETTLNGTNYVTTPDNYEFAFIAVANHLDSVSESNAVTAIKYENKKVLVKYKDETSFRVLSAGSELYFVYYQKKALPIGYKSMESRGVLENVPTTGAPADTGETLLGAYNMSSQLSAPLSLVRGFTNYAFAVGDIDPNSGTQMNASNLNLITTTAGSGDPVPTLQIRNTWRGFEYTTETGESAVWTSCGYAPQLYVIYYSQQPTVVMFNESTVGTSAVMDTEFTFNLFVTEVTVITESVQTQVKNGSGEWENSGEPTVTTTTGEPTTVFDTTAEGNHPYILKNSEAHSSILFYSSVPTVQAVENDNTRTVTTTTTETAQTVRITQTANDAFTTSINGTAQDTEPYEYTYTSTGTGGMQNATFTNTHKSLPVEVHVAMVENDGTIGGIIQRDSTFRSTTETAYKFDLALGESETILTKLPASTVFRGDADTYAFGAVMSGIESEGAAVTVGSMGIVSIAYELISDNVYELVLKDSGGDKIAELGSNQLYYLYYLMPKIHYVKEAADGTLSDITGCLANHETGNIEASDSVTYSHKPLTMNGETVAQNQIVEIPLSGLIISQSGNNFRMPPILDDGIYERYLSYVKLGAGSGGATNSSELDVSTGLAIQLKVQNNTLQYSFDGTTWTDLPLSGTPTIYVIYSERGYDFQISKTVDTSQSGENAIFSDSSFTVTISSTAITKDSYDAEDAESATVTATPATETEPGTIVLTVVDGTRVRIKGLGRGDYSVTESGNENYDLTARTGAIVGSSTSPMEVTNNTTVSFTLNTETKVDLTNSPKAICKIDDRYFYTLRSMVEYVDNEIATKTATAEMLTDYLMPAVDTVAIPNGCDITLTTAESVGHVAEITRTDDLADMPLFTNNGTLTLTNLTLEGNNITATAPMIRSAGDLTIGSGATIQNVVGGGAINATAGDVNVSGTIKNSSAAEGGAIYHSGNTTITLSGTGTIQNNTATTGSGGAIWLAGGTVQVSGTSEITGNKAESGSGGAVYCPGTVVIEIDQGGSITNNTAQEGGAIYAETSTISISETVDTVSPTVTGNTATTGNGGAIYVSGGSVTVSGGSVLNNKAEIGLGGAIYAAGASVTVSGTAEVKSNTAEEGGAVYAVSGAVEVSGGTVDNNTASTGDGGAVYAGSGNVTVSGGSLSNNTAEGSGGVIYAYSGNVALSGGRMSGNTANTDGGAVYAGSGSITVSVPDDGTPATIQGNTATDGNGGALCAGSGAVSVTGTTLTGNSAGTDGGAVYAGTGAVTLTNSVFGGETADDGNTAVENGGAVYAGSGNVTVSGGSMQNNTSTGGSGGALYAGSGIVALADTVVMTYNTAGGNGGALYVDGGSVTLPSATTMNHNSAVNGAAVFIQSGRATFTGGSYTDNTASSGGAVGMGSTGARLYFSGDVQVKDNKLETGEDASKSNIYLDQDSKDVLNMAGLGSSASLGIYVPDSLTSKRDVPGARFATYTDDSNVTTKISNDRRGFSVQKDTAAKQLFWGAKIKVEVRYQASFSAELPPTATYTTKKAAFDYYPEFDSAAISVLADNVKNSNMLNLTGTAVYAIAFAGDAAQYSDYVTILDWDDDTESWKLTKRDGMIEPLNNRTIVLYYAEPAYIAIENNTDSALNISSLSVGNDTIGPMSVINSASNAGYGTVYAKNGSVRPAFLPVTEDDLRLGNNAAITLLLPGGQGMTYNLDGTFESIASGTVRLRRGTASTPPEETLAIDDSGSFETLEGTTPSSNTTYKIIFGDDRYICKVVDSAGEEHRYTTISGAISDVKNATISLATEKTATIEMLVDYLLPSSDAVVVPAGYDITFTTASSGTYQYEPVDAIEPRATISRDTDNTNAMVSTASGSTATALTLTDLVFNVKGVQGSTQFGAVVANGSSVTVDNVDFTDLYANNGGAIFAQTASGTSNSWMKVTNSYFYNCHSTRDGSRDGGGAIHAYVDRLEVEGCEFDSCEGNWQAGAVFHRVEYSNNYSESLITDCVFTNCQSKAAGAMELGSRNIIVKGCSFEHCFATSRNGGGFNVYIMTSATGGGAPSFDCWTRVEDCTFNDCGLTAADGSNNGNGGGFRSSSKYTTIVNTTFTNCSSLKNGGAVALSNGNAVKAELYGVTISGCSAVTGGGIHSVGKQMVISDSYDVDADSNPIFANGTAKAPGGANLSHGEAAGTQFAAEMKVENCSATTVGGIYHDKNDNSATLTINNATITGNTATGSAGGGVSSKARTVTVTGSTISNNSAKGTGGGLNADYCTKLDLTKTTISNNTSTSNGGGVWINNNGKGDLVLTVRECTMDGNTAGDSGGAVYTPAKTVTVTDSQITNCTAAKTAGGIYQSQNSDGSSMKITGSGITGCTANNGSGGGIWSNVRELSITDSEVSKNSATSTGGGICYDTGKDETRALMALTVSGCTIDSNISNNNGGGIYTAAKTVNVVAYTYPEGKAPASTPAVGSYITDNTGAITGRRTEISNCKGTNGGGIWHSIDNIADSSLIATEATVTGCSATNGIGGGVYANVYYATFTDSEVSGNTASGNGGGIYKAKQNNAYYLILDASDVKNNTSGNQGGGVYCQSQLYLRNNSVISGNLLTSSTVDNAAGVYLENNRTLYMGPAFTDTTEAAAFTDSSSIKENYTASGADSNLRLWWASSQNASASVYVYCNLDGFIGVTNAAKVGTQFGTSLIANPNGFDDDSAVFQADTSTLHGIIDRTDEAGTRIIWAGPPIAKITGKDDEGNDILLYLKDNGTGPAIFDKLNAGNNGNFGTSSAFGILNTASPMLYTKNGTLYKGTTYSIKMLVESYTSEAYLMANYYEGRELIFTTAATTDTDGYPYEGRAGGRATVTRGTGTGNNNFLNANCNFTLTNIVIDGGSENSIAAQSNTRILNINNANAKVTLGENAVLQNASASSEGGGVNISNGILKINGGVIRNCSTTSYKDGGGVYVNGGQLLLEAGSIYQCSADASGGGVRVKNGIITMSGGTISGCTAVNGSGGGVYLGGGKVLNMSGGSIINNHAKAAGGGVAVYDASSRLYFSGKVNVSGNTCDVSDAANKACNVELNKDSNAVINTNYGGLYPGSYIGVYVNGTEGSNSNYDKHGVERKPFGTFATGDNTTTFYSFVNDRNGLKGGIIEKPSPNTIYWIQIFSIEVSKEIVSGNSTTVDPDETFLFEVNIRGNATVQGQLNAAQIDSSTGDYGEMQFTSNGIDTTTAVFALKNGESITGVNLSEGLTYEVIEYLTVSGGDYENQNKRYAAMPMNGYSSTVESLTYDGTTYQVVKANVYSSTIGENKSRTDVDPYTSALTFTNLMPVCKITDHDGKLLYRKYDWDKVTSKTGEGQDGGSSTDQPYYYAPAVYTELTGDDGAFKALEDTLYTSNSSNPTSYAVSNGVQIQMLIGNYSLNETVAANKSKVTLTTASASDAQFPKQDQGTTATIRRSFANGSMFEVTGDLTFATIILDGVKDTYTVVAGGGIANVANGGHLTIQDGAVLQNSRTAENYYGGAVYVASGGSVTMTGGMINRNESVDNGAGIYLAEGSTLNLSDAPSFGGTGRDVSGNITTTNGNFKTGDLVAQKNGGKAYSKARQDIYLAESQDNPASVVLTGNLDVDAGSIWIWAETENHYAMMMPFARIESEAVNGATYAAFRNAQPDSVTKCGGDNYLSGSSGDNAAFIYWAGGFDVSFMKTNGFGTALSGATFTLFTDPACTEALEQGGEDVSAVSADGTETYKDRSGTVLDEGIVLFEQIPAGVYYMKETVSPAGYVNALTKDDDGNPVSNVYIVLVGDAALQGAGVGVLVNITPEQITAQTGTGTDKKDAAVFLIDPLTNLAVATPDIATYGIMNIRTAERKVILRKVNNSFTPLDGFVFEILRYDQTLVSGTDISGDTTTNFTSGESGVYFADKLPFGTYYLHEIKDAKEQELDVWFTLTVDENDAGYKQTDSSTAYSKQLTASESTQSPGA